METRTLQEELGKIVGDLESISRRLSAIEERQVQSRHGSNIISLMEESQVSIARELGKLFPRDEILDRLPFIEIRGTEMAYMPEQQQQNRPLERLRAEFDWLPWDGQELRKVAKEALRSLVEQFHYLFFYGNPERGVVGLHQGIADEFALHAGRTTGTCLSWEMLDSLLSSLHEPELILSTPAMGTKVASYLNSVGCLSGVEWPAVPYGICTARGISWATTHGLKETETAEYGSYKEPVGGNCSSVFVLNFGALLGVTRGGIEVIRDVDRGKGLLQWDVGILHKDLRGLGKIDGIWSRGNVTR